MELGRTLVEGLRTEGVDHIFLVPGGLVDPLYPVLTDTEGVRPIVAAHEAGAAFMADGYARASGRFGACLCIGGPGVLNQLTPIATARTDFSPLLVLSGSVPTDFEGRGGFQDSSPLALDDVDVLRPVCRASVEVEHMSLALHHLRAVMTKMLAPPKAPVHLSVPTDFWNAEVQGAWEPLAESLYRPRLYDTDAVDRILDLLGAGPAHVAVYAGAGVEHSGASAELLELAERYELPVATTLRARGVFPEDHRLSLGIFGYAGHRHAIETLLSDEVEVLIVIGSGLGQRDTMFWSKELAASRALVHVDIDPEVPGRTYHPDVRAVGDARTVMRALLDARDDERAQAFARTANDRTAWLERIADRGPRLYEPEAAQSDDVPLHPARIITELRAACPAETILLVDSGAHRAFCAQYWTALEPRTYVSATNLGPMGWAIPASIGVKSARPDRPVVTVTGDGCMRMHGVEVQAAARYGIKVVLVVINNHALGNVNLRARAMGHGPDGLTSLPDHDWAQFARSLGADGVRVERPEELAPAFAHALEAPGPLVVDVVAANVPTPVSPWAAAKHEWMEDHA
jgi:acetolactate synthase I/II/III large subunit